MKTSKSLYLYSEKMYLFNDYKNFTSKFDKMLRVWYR